MVTESVMGGRPRWVLGTGRGPRRKGSGSGTRPEPRGLILRRGRDERGRGAVGRGAGEREGGVLDVALYRGIRAWGNQLLESGVGFIIAERYHPDKNQIEGREGEAEVG